MPTHFSVSAPPRPSRRAVHCVIVVTALDQSNTTAPGYNAAPSHFTSSDAGQASLPADATLSGGVGIFAVILKTAGNQTITATDTLTSGMQGISSIIDVSTGAATHFAIQAPASATTGISFPFTAVTALDAFNNPAPTVQRHGAFFPPAMLLQRCPVTLL